MATTIEELLAKALQTGALVRAICGASADEKLLPS